jgi:hypothetical protein
MFREQTAIWLSGAFNREERGCFACKAINAVFSRFVTDPGFQVGFEADKRAQNITDCKRRIYLLIKIMPITVATRSKA